MEIQKVSRSYFPTKTLIFLNFLVSLTILGLLITAAIMVQKHVIPMVDQTMDDFDSIQRQFSGAINQISGQVADINNNLSFIFQS